MHNPNSGEQRPPAEDLVGALEDLGFEVQYRSTKKKGWDKALADPGEFVIAAGGDGTIRKLAIAMVGCGVPLVPLPLGTANNIATTLGVRGDPLELLKRLDDARAVRFDLGMVRGVWNEARFLESVGAGLFAQNIMSAEAGAIPEPEASDRELRRDLRLLEATMAALEPRSFRIQADDEDLSGEYLAVEVMNVPMIGPNITLAPEADPCDGLLDLVVLSPDDEEEFVAYLRGEGPIAYQVRRVRHVRVEVEGGPFHLDDEVEETSKEVFLEATLETGALGMLLPS